MRERYSQRGRHCRALPAFEASVRPPTTWCTMWASPHRLVNDLAAASQGTRTIGQRLSRHALAGCISPLRSTVSASGECGLPTRPRRTPFIAGNWKTNPTSAEEARSLAQLLASIGRNLRRDKPELDVEMAVFPPSLFLSIIAEELGGDPGPIMEFGAQDMYYEANGAFTGAISAPMIKSLGCSYVLCGHSERRAVFGDADEDINRKVRAALEANLSPIICVGESKDEYEQGLVDAVCAVQLSKALRGVSGAELIDGGVVVAYEPVWAIGTGLTATPAIAQSVHVGIRQTLRELYGNDIAERVRIQYGGSVKPENVAELMHCPDVDGCLVGGASLSADSFQRICDYAAGSSGDEDHADRLWAQEVVKCQNVLGESPVWSAKEGKLYWVSAPEGQVWEWDLHSDPKCTNVGQLVGCCALRSDGGLILALGNSGIIRYDLETHHSEVICPFEPEENDTRANDGRCDRNGRFVIGSYNNLHRKNGKDIGGLYRLEGTELEEILDYRFRCSNGSCWSPDGKTMYFCDTPTRRIYAFDYNNGYGPLTNRRCVGSSPYRYVCFDGWLL
eukprot:scaffold401_cov399-Prasinococcus_capsulatus_cf.AAC.10